MAKECSDAVDVVGEVGGGGFGDARLSKRLPKIIAKMAEAPERSLPAIFNDAELEAAYRFFNNEAVTEGKILAPHVAATLGRIGDDPLTLVVHDTTTVKFGGDSAREGLGHVTNGGQGFFAHTSLAVSSDARRLPLGVLAMSTRIREARKKSSGSEHDRWLDHVGRVHALGLERSRIVHLMDREGDDYGVLASLLQSGSRFVIRSAHDRLLAVTSPDDARKLEAACARVSAVVEREAHLSTRGAGSRLPAQRRIHPVRGARTAQLCIGAASVTISRPSPQPKSLPREVTLHVVRVWEPAPPNGEAAVEWTLLTSEPIDTPEQLLRIVDFYRARWIIEEFFKAMKSGCACEKRQFESLHALVNCFATCIPIAWRLLRLRNQAREMPSAPASHVLSPTMLRVLAAAPRAQLPKKPTAGDVMRAIALLGGHQRQNGEPGWQILGRGYDKLLVLTEGWALAHGLDSFEDV
jgi:hypothetical protein